MSSFNLLTRFHTFLSYVMYPHTKLLGLHVLLLYGWSPIFNVMQLIIGPCPCVFLLNFVLYSLNLINGLLNHFKNRSTYICNTIYDDFVIFISCSLLITRIKEVFGLAYLKGIST